MCEIEKIVPKDAIHLYRMMWQFEKWLRLIVYVELYARDNHWEKDIAPHKGNGKKHSLFEKAFPPQNSSTDDCNKGATINYKKDDRSPKGTDKKLTHMLTAHQSSLSYLSLGELWDVIRFKNNKKNWELFKKYFPPEDITNASIQEIKNIRNRIMHFREPHEDDVARMKLFLKGFEPGVRLFCQSYATPVTGDKEDELVTLLTIHWGRVGHGVELHYLNCNYLYAPQPHRMNPKIHATLSLIRRPWSGSNGKGLLYKISIVSLRAFQDESIYELDIGEMIRKTKDIHDKCVHICINDNGEFSAIFPVHLGVETNFKIVSEILSAGVSCGTRPKHRDYEIEKLSRQMPEYVLWPDNPIFRYDDLMTENLINLD